MMNKTKTFCNLFAKSYKPVALNQIRLKSKKITYPKITLNDLPSPEGDFYTQYNAKQRAYNLHLAVGIGSLIAAIGFGIATDMYVFWNDIPAVPAEIDCYK